ncbi:MAG: hypothetical protein QOE55_6205 [Acidobacteriaceae bacterium]|nr:hypothetical protein [Acidobacteriaceae bacterium]
MASIQQPLFPEALPSPLSSRPERSGAERSLCGCLFLEMFFDGAKPRDLQFSFHQPPRPRKRTADRGSPGFPFRSDGFGRVRVVLFRENHMSSTVNAVK